MRSQFVSTTFARQRRTFNVSHRGGRGAKTLKLVGREDDTHALSMNDVPHTLPEVLSATQLIG